MDLDRVVYFSSINPKVPLRAWDRSLSQIDSNDAPDLHVDWLFGGGTICRYVHGP